MAGKSPGGKQVTVGGNFVAATPDTDVTAAAMANCALTVHVATKLNARTCTTAGRRCCYHASDALSAMHSQLASSSSRSRTR